MGLWVEICVGGLVGEAHAGLPTHPFLLFTQTHPSYKRAQLLNFLMTVQPSGGSPHASKEGEGEGEEEGARGFKQKGRSLQNPRMNLHPSLVKCLG